MNKLSATFTDRFGKKPSLARAPGRINVIGEHTDYSDGFVLPAAIDKYIYFAIAPNGSSCCNLHSLDKNESYTIDLEKPFRIDGKVHWANYLIGTVSEIAERGYSLEGFDCMFEGNIPIGAGMSSSAALECGFALAISHIFDLGIDKFSIAKIGQQAEHKFAGTKCGIMDQFASLFGKDNNLIRLDCRSLEYEYVSLADTWDYEIVLANTHVKHTLAESSYNARRAQCEQGVAVIQKRHPEVRALRDVSLAMLETFADQLDPEVYTRCEYVIEENLRVEDACRAIRENDTATFGRLVYASHEGLKNKYEVSCKELDDFVHWATEIDGVLGARMMGGGFGGCTINLVQTDAAVSFESHLRQRCLKQYGFTPDLYREKISRGAEIIE